MQSKVVKIEQTLKVLEKRIKNDQLSEVEKHEINKKINDIIKKIKLAKIYENNLIEKIKGKFE